ncbi:hypothetical protein [Actinokineospora sp. NPDC004072]
MRPVWLLVLVVAGCASGQEPVAPRYPPIPVFTAEVTTPPPRTERKVPRDCGLVMTREDLADLLKVKLSGGTADIAGVPVPDIGRTARVDCYFGIPRGERSKAAVIVSLAAYTTPEAAQERIDSTVADQRNRGAAVTEVPVGAGTGHYVQGASRMVIARYGRVTVVVDAVAGLVADDQARRVLPQVADRALTE